MKFKHLISISLFLTCLSDTSGFALDYKKMYESSVPVQGQGSQERKAAIDTAFKEVLIAVTGDRNITLKETVSPVTANSERYVKQFRYQVAPVSAPNPADQQTGGTQPTQSAPEKPQLFIWVQFDQKAVNKALKSVGECIWGQRQDTLVWLVIDQRGRRSLVSVEAEDEYRRLLKESSDRRGLPLIFPLYDLQDQMQLKESDIWGNFAGPILTTSRRYGSHAVLVGRIALSYGSNWEGKWALYETNNVDQWNSMGGSLQEALSGGVDGSSDILARRFKERYCKEGVDSSVILTVNGVSNLRHFVQAQKYLESLQSVESVSMESVNGSSIIFKLALRGTTEDLTRNISVDARMVPASPSTESPNPSSQLEFRYLP